MSRPAPPPCPGSPTRGGLPEASNMLAFRLEPDASWRSRALEELGCVAGVEMGKWVAKGPFPLSLIRKHYLLYNQLPEQSTIKILNSGPPPA